MITAKSTWINGDTPIDHRQPRPRSAAVRPTTVSSSQPRERLRWGLSGAEAILKVRALRGNGDFVTYRRYHLAQERCRVHESRYLNGHIPQAA